MLIPNIVTKIQSIDIFYKICYMLVLSSAHARRIVSVNYTLTKLHEIDIAINLSVIEWKYVYIYIISFYNRCTDDNKYYI